MLDTYATAVNGADVATLLGYYTNDAIRMPSNEPAVAGMEAVRSWMQSSLDQSITNGFSFPQVEVEVAGDWAFARAAMTGTQTPKTGGDPTDFTGKAVAIYKRQPDGFWKACCDIWNSDKTLPVPGK
jgi:ketosteroid isomerase-like protein